MPDPTAPRRVLDRWLSTFQCLTVVVLGCLGFAWLARASQRTELGQRVDQAGMEAVYADESGTRELIRLVGNVSIGSLILAVVVLAGLAVMRRRYDAALAAVVLVGGANVTTQVFKHSYARADFGMLTVASLPSGHTTVVTSVTLAALLVTPPAWRMVVSLLGSLGITITATTTLVGAWHRPADVAAALLVCLVWGCAVLAVWALADGGAWRRPGQPHGALSLVGTVLAAALLIGVGVRPSGGWSGVLDAAVVLAGIGLSSAAVVRAYAALSAPLALRERAPSERRDVFAASADDVATVPLSTHNRPQRRAEEEPWAHRS